MVRVGFAVWNERIAPVFDTAGLIHVVDAHAGRIVDQRRAVLPSESPGAKATRLAELAVNELVCGAISYPLRTMVTAYGIGVCPFITGPLNDIIRAWFTSTISAAEYAMPGCCGGRGHRVRTRSGARQEGGIMQATNRPGGNPKGGGRGRMGGRFAGGPGGVCVCPQCGHQEPHERGVPCTQSRCPKCGLPMTRG